MMLLGGFPFKFCGGFLIFIYLAENFWGKKTLLKRCPLCTALGSLCKVTCSALLCTTRNLLMNSTKPRHYVQLLDMQMWITISLASCCRHADVDVEPERGSNPICVSDLKMTLAICSLFNFLLLNGYWICVLCIIILFSVLRWWFCVILTCVMSLSVTRSLLIQWSRCMKWQKQVSRHCVGYFSCDSQAKETKQTPSSSFLCKDKYPSARCVGMWEPEHSSALQSFTELMHWLSFFEFS